jgi:hypothetical protein
MKFFLILSSLFFSCVSNVDSYEEQKDSSVTKTIKISSEKVYFDKALVLEIDSCEYLYIPSGNGSWGAHKGNCKFCKIRNSLK